jgi:hypothetical protein
MRLLKIAVLQVLIVVSFSASAQMDIDSKTWYLQDSATIMWMASALTKLTSF